MKTNSSNNNIQGEIQRINGKIQELNLEQMARESGFQRREARKIRVKDLLMAFFLMVSSKDTNSFESWAIKLAFLTKQRVSKQAVWLKMTPELIKFLERLLSEILSRSVGVGSGKETKMNLFSQFNDVIVEDSMNQSLKKVLLKDYPGNVNQQGEAAILKIDAVYSLKTGVFKHFKLTNYRDNDITRSMEILEYAKPGDLVIRDLGYFLLDTFKEMNKRGIYLISRLHTQRKIYDVKTGEKIDLIDMMKNRDFIDKTVLVERKKKMPMRLIVVRLDPKRVNERRRKARLIRRKRTEEYISLLEFAIYLTNVPEERLSVTQLVRLYALRWRIEIIFKTWKSYLKIGEVVQFSNKIRVDSYILIMLIYIVLFIVNFHNCLEQYSDRISIMKLSKYLISNFGTILMSFRRAAMQSIIIEQILYYCCYDKRNRNNYNDQVLCLT